MQSRFGETTGFDALARPRWPRRALRRMRSSIGRVADTLALWHFRARSRRELEQVEDRLLKDMGGDRSEAYKPFWRE